MQNVSHRTGDCNYPGHKTNVLRLNSGENVRVVGTLPENLDLELIARLTRRPVGTVHRE